MLVLVVDIANVMGSRPDGWWRDRAGAAERLMVSLVPLVAASVAAPPGFDAADGSTGEFRVDRIVAVLEGRARTAVAPAELQVVLAPADGDSAVVAIAQEVVAEGGVPLVITADRGLRDSLPTGAQFTGPGWLLALL